LIISVGVGPEVITIGSSGLIEPFNAELALSNPFPGFKAYCEGPTETGASYFYLLRNRSLLVVEFLQFF